MDGVENFKKEYLERRTRVLRNWEGKRGKRERKRRRRVTREFHVFI